MLVKVLLVGLLAVQYGLGKPHNLPEMKDKDIDSGKLWLNSARSQFKILRSYIILSARRTSKPERSDKFCSFSYLHIELLVSLDIHSPTTFPLFDGSDTSIGSDGTPIPHGDLMIQNPRGPLVWRNSPGAGGGCIHSGPFVNMTINFLPKALSLPGTLDEVRNNDSTGYSRAV
ncbi:hypothetical protein B0T14DRAFT_498740 [Immersiella caudata]|uniref:Uncharacterized protein n=1 Tax=Immersiella caudata TaxID=314043 RepID=A0AA39TUX5_9PEZI|nr:hypothetical protein B0T14DRAFT_498740 [Immersiella caudata]